MIPSPYSEHMPHAKADAKLLRRHKDGDDDINAQAVIIDPLVLTGCLQGFEAMHHDKSCFVRLLNKAAALSHENPSRLFITRK